MNEVARQAGVSTMTVSRVLRNHNAVSNATRERVQKVVDELGYVLDQSAGALSSRRTGFVACIVPSLNNSNFADTVHGISESLQGSQLQILLGYTNYSTEKEEELVRSMLQRRPEAFIVTGGNHTAQTRRLLRSCGVPVIEMWDTPAEPIDHVVGFSNAQASGDLVRRLHASGYRSIGFIGGTTNRDTRGADRRRGFIEAAGQLGLPVDHIVTFGVPPISMRQGGQAVVQILDRWPDTDAVMCVSDLSAFGAIVECGKRGWTVPGRIAVAGFGDFEVAACSHPSISTVSVDCYGIGQSVGQIVQQAIAERAQGDKLASQFVLAEYRVQLREST